MATESKQMVYYDPRDNEIFLGGVGDKFFSIPFYDWDKIVLLGEL